MRFMKRDFCAILKLGQLLIAESDNSQSVEAARKLIYDLARFVSEDQIESVMLIAQHLDMQSSAAALSTLGEEEATWAKELLYDVATTNGPMNESQEHIWQHITDATEKRAFDFEL